MLHQLVVAIVKIDGGAHLGDAGSILHMAQNLAGEGTRRSAYDAPRKAEHGCQCRHHPCRIPARPQVHVLNPAPGRPLNPPAFSR